MPQTPLGTMYLIRRTFAQLKLFAATAFSPTPPSTGGNVSANADPMGNLIVSGVGGYASALALSNTAGTVVKASPGMLIRAIVTVAGTTIGGIFDTATTASQAGITASTAQMIATIPNATGIYEFDFPCLVGIMVQPGQGQQVTISYQ